jgi:Arc/MetJ-type ribon-helix-helix transcriptional regulator
MPSTTVHIPDELLSKVDKVVRDKGISRNRFIIDACKAALAKEDGQWPPDFFESEYGKKDLNLLKEGAAEMTESILRTRRNRMEI